jgi:hypothetical protein
VDGDHRLAQIHVPVEAVVAQLQAELIFVFRQKTAVALVAGRDLLVLRKFAGVYLGMDFDHWNVLPTYTRQTVCHPGVLKKKHLNRPSSTNCAISPKEPAKIHRARWKIERTRFRIL